MGRLERLARGEQDVEAATQQRGALTQQRSAPARVGPQHDAGATTTTPTLTRSALELETRLRAAGLEPPLDAELDPGDLAALRTAGRAIRVSKNLHFHADTLVAARDAVIELADRHGGSVTLAQLRDELDTSRKFAQALLEHFDSEKLTIRRGDAHYLRGSARSG
jgi:hypothetical protein